jgi:hypothetical protein
MRDILVTPSNVDRREMVQSSHIEGKGSFRKLAKEVAAGIGVR